MRKLKPSWLSTSKLASSKVIAVFLIVIFTVFFSASAKKLVKKIDVDTEIDRLKSEIKSLEIKKNRFDEVLVYLESDQYVEDEARLKLGLKKPGEHVLVIKDLKVEESNNNVEFDDRSNTKKWIDYFF